MNLPAERKRLRGLALGVTLGAAAALGVAGWTGTAAAANSTPAQVRALVRHVGGASGAYVFDVTGQSAIAARSAGAKRILASNTKLFTAAAALGRYGADGVFTTALYTNGSLDNGVLTGDLYLRGGGDPLFGSADFVRKRFGGGATAAQLALSARVAGLTRVTGHVYGDETAFDAMRGTAPYGFGRSWEIGGQLSGLVFNEGLDSGHFQTSPPRFAAAQLRSELKRAGVAVDAGSGAQATPPTATLLAQAQSPPLSKILRLMDKPSNNYLAEMLLKDLGVPAPAATGGDSGAAAPTTGFPPPATSRGGARAARLFAASLGARVSLTDGSGLSRADRAAPREVVDLLRALSARDDFSTFADSLPVPGVDGTLYNRMRGTEASKRCHAKTGTLSNVSALSGFCTTAGGHRVAFSILQNAVTPWRAHIVQDKIVTTIARLP